MRLNRTYDLTDDDLLELLARGNNPIVAGSRDDMLDTVSMSMRVHEQIPVRGLLGRMAEFMIVDDVGRPFNGFDGPDRPPIRSHLFEDEILLPNSAESARMAAITTAGVWYGGAILGDSRLEGREESVTFQLKERALPPHSSPYLRPADGYGWSFLEERIRFYASRRAEDLQSQ